MKEINKTAKMELAECLKQMETLMEAQISKRTETELRLKEVEFERDSAVKEKLKIEEKFEALKRNLKDWQERWNPIQKQMKESFEVID